MAAGLGPLVRTYAPADDGALAAPSSEELRTITAVLGDLSSELAEQPSAGTEVNVARSGLRTTVDLFTAAVTARELAAAVDGGGDARLESHATDLGRQGLRAWTVAATQVDAVNVAAGNGHVHVQLLSEEPAIDH